MPAAPKLTGTARSPAIGGERYWLPTRNARRRHSLAALSAGPETLNLEIWGRQLQRWRRARRMWAGAVALIVLAGLLMVGMGWGKEMDVVETTATDRAGR